MKYPWLHKLLCCQTDEKMIELYQSLSNVDKSEVLLEIHNFEQDIISATMPAIQQISNAMGKLLNTLEDWIP